MKNLILKSSLLFLTVFCLLVNNKSAHAKLTAKQTKVLDHSLDLLDGALFTMMGRRTQSKTKVKFNECGFLKEEGMFVLKKDVYSRNLKFNKNCDVEGSFVVVPNKAFKIDVEVRNEFVNRIRSMVTIDFVSEKELHIIHSDAHLKGFFANITLDTKAVYKRILTKKGFRLEKQTTKYFIKWFKGEKLDFAGMYVHNKELMKKIRASKTNTGADETLESMLDALNGKKKSEDEAELPKEKITGEDCPPGALKLEFNMDFEPKKHVLCEKKVDGVSVKHGPYRKYNSLGKLVEEKFYKDGFEVKGPISTVDNKSEDASIPNLGALLRALVPGQKPGHISFSTHNCDSDLKGWFMLFVMKKSFIQSYKFDQNCDVEGSFSPAAKKAFPVEFKLKNFDGYDFVKMDVLLDVTGRNQLQITATNGVLTGKNRIEFNGIYRGTLRVSSKRIELVNHKGKMRVVKLNENTVSIDQNIEVK